MYIIVFYVYACAMYCNVLKRYAMVRKRYVYAMYLKGLRCYYTILDNIF